MSTEPNTKTKIMRNGWNPSTVEREAAPGDVNEEPFVARDGPTAQAAAGSAAREEAALDEVIEDSFPASDPPSHTPTTGLGAPKGTLNENLAPRPWSRRLAPVAAGVVLAVIGVFVIRRRSKPTAQNAVTRALAGGPRWGR
jgi:hypothetical protein